MSSILEELELCGKKCQVTTFSPNYLNQLRRSGKDVDNIKDLSESFLIEWHNILLDRYDGRALLSIEDLACRSDSQKQQQKPNEKYEEDLCDIERYQDLMTILGDSYLMASQDPPRNSVEQNNDDNSFKNVGWSYEKENSDNSNKDDANVVIKTEPQTEITIKQEPIEPASDVKEVILTQFQELSTNLNEITARQSNISEEMLKSLVENSDLTLIVSQLKAVNEFTVKLNEKLKLASQPVAIKWRPAIQVPPGMAIPDDEAQNKIIERTAQFFKDASKDQIEKFKENQANNDKLAFVKKDHALFPYFDFLLKPEQQQAQMIIMNKINEEKRVHLQNIVQEQLKIQEERKKIEQEALVPKKVIQITDPPFEIKMFIQVVVRLIRKYGKKFEDWLKNEEKDNKNFDFFHSQCPLSNYFEEQKNRTTPVVQHKSNINNQSTSSQISSQSEPQKSAEEIKMERKRKMKDFLANLEAKGEISTSNNTNINNTGDNNERENKRQKLS